MSEFKHLVDSYCERYHVNDWDRRKLLAHWPLFRLHWVSVHGSERARGAAASALRPFRGYELVHHVRGPGTRRIRVPIRFHPNDLASFREIFFGDEYASPIDLSSARTYVDLGANTGMAALWFAAVADLQKLVLVEANPDLGGTLWRNVRPSVGNALVVIDDRAVVGIERPEGIRFHVSPNHRHSSIADVGGREITVAAVRLTDLLDAHGLVEVDVLKMDIEGGERELIESDPKGIARARTIFAEVHGDAIERERFTRALADLGFRIVQRSDHPEYGVETVAAERAR